MLEFDWDAENIVHIARHGVTPEDVEYALTHHVVEVEYQDWHDDEEGWRKLAAHPQGESS